MDVRSDPVLGEVLAAYGVRHSAKVVPLGDGNINTTYLVQDDDRRLVMQCLNGSVFPQPEVLIDNAAVISRHLEEKADSGGQGLVIPHIIRNFQGKYGFHDSQYRWWRALNYISHQPGRELDIHQVAGGIGRVLALFHLLTADLDMQKLADPLPGFHDTPRYLRKFDQLLSRWQGPRADGLDYCLKAVETHRAHGSLLAYGLAAGKFSIRVIHGDPKLDNLIVDEAGKTVGLFDLDTTGPGLLLTDLGDCLRSCCSKPKAGSESDIPASFDLDICQNILAGYFSVAGVRLSEAEREAIFTGVLGLTFELGLRFLIDHLEGDIYFKVDRCGDNLFRAQRQFILVEDIVSKEGPIRKFAPII